MILWRSALVLVAVSGAVLLSGCGTASGSGQAAATVPSVVPTTASSTAPKEQRPTPRDYGAVHPVPEKDAAYLACARRMGSPVAFVQVIGDGEGKPMGAKTDVEVPADIHRPCLLEVGGYDRQQSSYGDPPVADTSG